MARSSALECNRIVGPTQKPSLGPHPVRPSSNTCAPCCSASLMYAMILINKGHNGTRIHEGTTVHTTLITPCHTKWCATCKYTWLLGTDFSAHLSLATPSMTGPTWPPCCPGRNSELRRTTSSSRRLVLVSSSGPIRRDKGRTCHITEQSCKRHMHVRTQRGRAGESSGNVDKRLCSVIMKIRNGIFHHWICAARPIHADIHVYHATARTVWRRRVNVPTRMSAEAAMHRCPAHPAKLATMSLAAMPTSQSGTAIRWFFAPPASSDKQTNDTCG